MEEGRIWHFFYQIADAVRVMHECRVMHRDIKPQNIFLTEEGHIKLGDLGLGRYFSSKTQETFSIVGTPFYMSPEAMFNQGYNFQSDIWSLGCVLYELAALRSPFQEAGTNFWKLGSAVRISSFLLLFIPTIVSTPVFLFYVISLNSPLAFCISLCFCLFCTDQKW